MNLTQRDSKTFSPRRIRVFLLGLPCAILLLAVAWNAYASREEHRSGFPNLIVNADGPAMDSRTDGRSSYSNLELGRLELLAGDPRRAALLLKAAKPQGLSEDQLRSFLLWQANQKLKDSGEAEFWRRSLLANIHTLPSDDRDFFEHYQSDGKQSVFTSLPVASTATDAGLQSNEVADLTSVVRHMSSARQAYSTTKSIENRIRLATWLLLFGELAGEEKRGGLVSNAIDATTEGVEHLEAIEKDIASDQALEDQISKDTAVAIRLDAARVRRVAISRRLALARGQETERLKQLREIVRSYRDLTQRLSLVHAEYLVEDYESAKKLNEAALADAERVAEIVQRRRDFFLFSDEPQLNPETDLAAAITAPSPFSASVIAHLKGLHALLAFQLADSGGQSKDQKLLSEAETWARAALSDTEAVKGAPAGHDENCITAHYALALITEAQGIALTSADLFEAAGRTAAKTKFDNSRTEFVRVRELLKGQSDKTANSLDLNRALAQLNPVAATTPLSLDDSVALVAQADAPNALFSRLLVDVNRRAELLESPLAYMRAAEEATMSGKTNDAWLLLTEGMRRHADAALAAAWLDAGLRNNIDADELRQRFAAAASAGIIKASDPQSQLTFAKIGLKAAWKQIAAVGLGNFDDAAKSTMDSDLQTYELGLRDALVAANKPTELGRAELQSYLALVIAYRAIVMPSANTIRTAEEGYRLAQDAAAAEEKALKDAQGLRGIELREALVAARLAIGHLAVVALPNYRDESLLAFASAFDESAKLPMPTADLKAVGSPILNAIMNRPENAAAKLAQEERQQRLLITKFLEAAFTVNFGAPGAASDQMKTALANVPITAQGASSGTPEASALLAGADGFEAKAALRDSVRAFQVLTDITANRPISALAESCRILIPDKVANSPDDQLIESLGPEALSTAIGRVQSPLVGYALGTAIESYAESLPGMLNPRRPALMKSAEQAFSMTKSLLDSPAARSRYPQLVTLTEQSQQRFTQPALLLEAGRALRQRGDILGAIAAFERGLKRHPQSAALWQVLLETKLNSVLDQKASAANTYDDLLAQLAEAEESRLLSNSVTDYFRGVIYRRQGKFDEAARSLTTARSNAPPEDRVRIGSELAAVRLRTTSTAPTR